MTPSISSLIDKLGHGTKGRDKDDPSQPLAYTMTGRSRMEALVECVESILDRDIPGDFIECGVWRGGSCILMRAILAERGVTDRTVWVCDSFEGLPKPDAKRYPLDKGGKHYRHDFLRVPLEVVQKNFADFGLLDNQVKFVKGFFRDSLSQVTASRFAILRLDGDIYESTIQPLEALFPRLSSGGFLLVDDYLKGRVKAAVDDYYATLNQTYKPRRVGKQAAYWTKTQ